MSEDETTTDPAVLTALAEMRVQLSHVTDQLAELKDELDKKYVTKAQFEPVRLFMYSLFGAGFFALLNTILQNAGLTP